MINVISIILGKAIIFLSNTLNLGSGSTWPGHIALSINPNFIKDILRSHMESGKLKVIIIAGTNGKTTTGRLVTSIIRENGKTYLQNKAGANLINGLASAIIKGASIFSLARRDPGRLNQDYLIFESDENALPEVLQQTNPDYVIVLNLFRDQLDRYGEVNTIAKKWQKAFEKLDNKTVLILNTDDPQVSFLSKKTNAKVLFFGLDKTNGENKLKHGADSIYCPKCFHMLDFTEVHFSHLGSWSCTNCNLKRPKPDLSNLSYYPLPGTYNKYNSLAAALFAKAEKISSKKVKKAFKSFTPAFGRQEKIKYKGRYVQLFLSKNPTSFNESLSTVKELGGKNFLLVLNDRIPDGLDVSWIWDINFEEILDKNFNITVAGDRCYDMGLRLKYAEFFTHIEPDLRKALDHAVENISSEQVLYILPNYSSMLEIRKILTGRKIL
ncbi:MAG: Mur ligase family protein [Candidatus Levybacteria bacterium]|nr:Mur ligase family protein [Candidatus Levybacteria bacterium]